MDVTEMEKRLQALEDLEAIRQLQYNYMFCLDNLKFEEVLELFTDDAEVEVRNSGVMKGRESYSKIYLGTLAKRKERHDGHLVGMPVITINGDRAKGNWVVYMLFSVPDIEWIQGRNDCEYRKENGTWKISKLKFTRTLASKPELYP